MDRAGGHPLFLEELARAHAGGGVDSALGTLGALVEARLLQLDPGDRRTLRAASVFGMRFWDEGVAALLGVDLPHVHGSIDRLARAELCGLSPTHRFGDLREHAFRQALVREAAYAMLPDADRAAGHRAALRWLTSAGERDQALLVEHLERGAESDEDRCEAVARLLEMPASAEGREAVRWLERARAVAGGIGHPGLRDVAALRLLEGEVRIFVHSDRGLARSSSDRLVEACRRSGRMLDVVRALAGRALFLASDGRFDAAEDDVAEAIRLAGHEPPPDIRASLARGRAMVLYYRGNLEGFHDATLESLAAAREAGLLREQAIESHNAADSALRLGRVERAIEFLDLSDSLVSEHGIGAVMHNSVLRDFVAGMRGDPDAVGRIDAFARKVAASGADWVELECRLYGAILDAWCGDPSRAAARFEEVARDATARRHVRLADEARACRQALDAGERPWFRGGTPPGTPS